MARVERESDPLWQRYSRQILFPGWGREAQEKLAQAHIAVVGCGALGSAQADLLVRAGVGRLTLIDRDYVEASNLQRQRLYDEADAREGTPKALAAAAHLRAVNGESEIRAVVADLTPENVADLLAGAAVIADGTDNLETRYLLNDYSLDRGVPWVYGAVVGSYGVTFTIRPGVTACLECVFGPQPAEVTETCDTHGVLNWAVDWVAAQQAGEALKLAVGAGDALRATVASGDLWRNSFRQLQPPAPDSECRACARRDFAYLRGQRRPHVTLCGRDSVQIHEDKRVIAFPELARKLAPWGEVRFNDFVFRFRPAPAALPAAGGAAPRSCELTVFPDGRAIVKGTSDVAVARSFYARYVSC